MDKFERTENQATPEKSSREFRVGDFIVFDESLEVTTEGFAGNQVSAVGEMIRRYGKGPFRVLSIRENDPASVEVGMQKQILRIERPDGELIYRNKVEILPGAWFKKYSTS